MFLGETGLANIVFNTKNHEFANILIGLIGLDLNTNVVSDQKQSRSTISKNK